MASSSSPLLVAAKSSLALFLLLGIGIWLSLLFSGALPFIIKFATAKDYVAARYTGIPGLDILLAFQQTAYLSTSAGGPTPKTLEIVHFFGSMGSTWVVLILETCRQKSFAQVVNRIIIWGFACMFLGPNVAMPLYYLAHFPDGQPDSHNNILDNWLLINHLPIWKVFFYFIPFSLLHLPGSYALPDKIKSHLIIFFICWPATVMGTAYFTHTSPDSSLRAPVARSSIMQQLRSGYVFSFYIAVASHVGSIIWCLSLGETPGQAMYAMFTPPVPWGSYFASNPQEMISFVVKSTDLLNPPAMCVWALVSYLTTCRQQGIDVVGLLLNLSWMLVLGGPYAVAIQLLIMKHDFLIGQKK